uniref:Uncharacterized protein n=1 Tax=Candidatus Kentrum eta TaxID=2126337 RepID=A0A450UYV9_9GAMM|nr:MAG: hypothetical protein BECKH772B_GA0070898_1011710 [Candidatus Kentron sp. H]VFK02955.1 MAG: hypothetical protein BECKH772C_GA0070978_1010910 [Candidatus Kentron sp. H]
MARMPRLGYTKRLRLDEAARIGEGRAFPGEEPTADFGDLLAMKAAGQREVVCKFGRYDLQKLLHLMPRGMAEAPKDRPTLEPAPGPAFEKKATDASRWDKGMLALSGLGGLAAIVGLIIGGDGRMGWFEKFLLSDELPPSVDSLGVALMVGGSAMILAAVLAWLRRRGL